MGNTDDRWRRVAGRSAAARRAINDRIWTTRKRLRISQTEVAYRVGLPEASYRRIELGFLDPAPKVAESIAKVLRVDARELFPEALESEAVAR